MLKFDASIFGGELRSCSRPHLKTRRCWNSSKPPTATFSRRRPRWWFGAPGAEGADLVEGRCLGSWQRVERQPDHRSSGNQPIHGLPGAEVVEKLKHKGHEAIAAAPNMGVNTITIDLANSCPMSLTLVARMSAIDIVA
jgi:hypothetical protein